MIIFCLAKYENKQISKKTKKYVSMYWAKKNGKQVSIKDKFNGKCIELAILYWKFKSCFYPFKSRYFITP